MVVCIQISNFFLLQNDSRILKDLEGSQHEAVATKNQDSEGKFAHVCFLINGYHNHHSIRFRNGSDDAYTVEDIVSFKGIE